MSLRKKRPGKIWVTGIQRAQLRKVIVLINSLKRAQTRIGGVLPVDPATIADLSQAQIDCVALLALKS